MSHQDSVCDWKDPIDSGDFIVLVIDRAMLGDPDVEMQVIYAMKTGKKIRALIEMGGAPPDYLTSTPDFMWEPFNPDDEKSYKTALSRLMNRHFEGREFDQKPRFLCFMGPGHRCIAP